MASGCGRQQWQELNLKHWAVPSPPISCVHHPWSTSTKSWTQPVSTVWKNAGRLWRISVWHLHLMGCRKQELDSPLHYEVQSKLTYNLIMHFINTITVGQEYSTRPGHRHPFPTQLCCWAECCRTAVAINGMQRLCQVWKLNQGFILFARWQNIRFES